MAKERLIKTGVAFLVVAAIIFFADKATLAEKIISAVAWGGIAAWVAWIFTKPA